MVHTHLKANYDVVVPQLVATAESLDRLAELGAEPHVEHIEFVLLDDLERAERRFHARLDDPFWGEHQRVAARLVDHAGGCAEQYRRLMRCLSGGQAIEVNSIAGDSDATYRSVVSHL